MRHDTPLATLLFRSHAALALLAIVALVVPVGGLLYTRSLVSRVIDVEMLDVDAEEAVHRAAWQVEVAARRASRLCLADPTVDPATIVPDIVAADRALEAALARHGGRDPEHAEGQRGERGGGGRAPGLPLARGDGAVQRAELLDPGVGELLVEGQARGRDAPERGAGVARDGMPQAPT